MLGLLLLPSNTQSTLLSSAGTPATIKKLNIARLILVRQNMSEQSPPVL
jgi:hypothetical protein